VNVPESVFGVAWNNALMHQVVTSMQDNARTPVAHVKDRGEVRGGGKKPWRQKGTGRSRHGSSRSPIWIGGGVTHGPRNEKDYSRAIPKKMRAKALFMALSRKFKEGKIIFVDSFGLETPKTAAAKNSLTAFSKIEGFGKLATKRKNAAVVALADGTEATKKSFRNIGNIDCVAVRNLNPVTILGATYLIIENPEAAVAIVEDRATRLGKAADVVEAATKAAKATK
jgi:large subunit ribosomal protein L4